MSSAQKPQLIYIHGGDAFTDTADLYEMLRSREWHLYAPERITWQKTLFANMADTYDCFRVEMPNPWWADYTAWQIWFEKIVPELHDELVLVGHSLGGGFLLRYLSEHKLPVKVQALHLVAGVVDDLDCPGVGGFQIDLKTWAGFATEITAVHVWHSEDDTIVPFHHAERLVAKCPPAIFHKLNHYGHFLTENFPELTAVIKGSVNS